MSLALQSLVGLTLLVCAGVAAVPLLVDAPEPRPDPGVSPGVAPALRVVEAPGGRWYLNGEPIGRESLASLLRDAPTPQPVQFLPSAALGVGEVAASLRWLRRNGRGGALLALPPPNRESETAESTPAAAPPPLP